MVARERNSQCSGAHTKVCSSTEDGGGEESQNRLGQVSGALSFTSIDLSRTLLRPAAFESQQESCKVNAEH